MIRISVFLTIILVSKSAAQSLSFRPITAANGSTLCAVGGFESSDSVGNILGIPAGVPDKVKCSYRCSELNTYSECSSFNYVNNGPNDKQCQFYQYRPSRCVVGSPGCLYYETISSITPLSAPTCSFPFTYNGALYNTCLTSGTPPSVGWYCYSIDSTRISCPSAFIGYYVNVALNRPAFQINTYTTTSVASNAVKTDAPESSCTVHPGSTGYVQHWWAVDLGQPSNVIAVNVTNDGNLGWYIRLNNFFLWLSNKQPTVGQPLSTSNCSLCSQYQGSVPASATVLMQCPLGLPSSRYVIIQTSSLSSLCLKHVEVYVGYPVLISVVNVTIPVTMKSVPLKSVNGWLVILSRVDANFTFNATWSAYGNVFGNASSNFWLGLESLYQLTSELFQTTCGQFYRLRFELKSASSDRWYSEEYDWFYVDGESNGYALHVPTSGAGDAGDALNSPMVPTNSVNGMQFYSYDRDNSNQCAAKYGGGWWNNQCSSSNVMGSLYGGFVWKELLINRAEVTSNGGGRLNTARVMIRSTV